MKGKILVVDDSGLARRGTRRVLEGAGYAVVEAEDGMVGARALFRREAAIWCCSIW